MDESVRRAFRSRLLYRLVALLARAGRGIPLRASRALGRILGTVAFLVLRRVRKQSLRNLEIAFPEWSARKRLATVRAMLQHLGVSLFEIFWLPNMTNAMREQTTTFEGFEAARAFADSGRAVVAFTGHCGNWEWLAYAVANCGYPVAVLQRERSEGELNQLITRIRATSGIRTIDRGSQSAARELMRSLRSPGFLAFLVDQNIRTESARVPFFGRNALTPIGPARLAIRAEAIVVPVFIERRDGRQHIRFLEPVETSRSDDPIALTARLTRDIEEQIRRVPEQWVWMHDRWKERTGWDVAERE